MQSVWRSLCVGFLGLSLTGALACTSRSSESSDNPSLPSERSLRAPDGERTWNPSQAGEHVREAGPEGITFGGTFSPGEMNETPLPPTWTEGKSAAQASAAKAVGVADAKQILFGDTHVHTTYSVDAYEWSLPMMQGSRGAYPPADVCDFARYASALDFFFLTDHAEAYTPQHWRDAKAMIRQCNALAGDPENPDLVAFLGYEWTNIGLTAEDHFGHHNVLFKGQGEDELPKRPVASRGSAAEGMRSPNVLIPDRLVQAVEEDEEYRQYYYNFNQFVREMAATPRCAEGVHTRELPDDCFEQAATLKDLYKKLDELSLDTIVIPHGGTWGYYTPPDASWEHQLKDGHFNAEKSPLIEVFSGHGNSEEYRGWKLRLQTADGRYVCPDPTPDFLPSCYQAGEIIRERCLDQGFEAEDCDGRAAEARQLHVEIPHVGAWLTVPQSIAAEWLDAGQCRDCFLPTMNLRPTKSVQYGLALRNFDDPNNPLRYTWGFIASSDNHRAAPGTGYKQYDRTQMTESNGVRDPRFAAIRGGQRDDPPPARAQPLDPNASTATLGFNFLEAERQSSFFLTGGLAAVHADGRDRDAIWNALKRKEVYGTSGPRILLWFDMLNEDGSRQPMGTHTELGNNPRFEVRAVGAFKQLPGCPEHTVNALSKDRLDHITGGECYNPSDERYLITRIEVVRVQPQDHPDEPVDGLIEDVWQSFECPADPAGCVVQFSDDTFQVGARDALYYVRAIQEETPRINGALLRTTVDEKGRATAVEPCYGDYRTPLDEACMADVEERAWSSPIYVDFMKQD